MGILIEPNQQMAERNGYDIVKIQRVQQESTDRDKITVLSIFQYLIGNTDWSVPALHNGFEIGFKGCHGLGGLGVWVKVLQVCIDAVAPLESRGCSGLAHGLPFA